VTDTEAFIRTHTVVGHATLVPEITLHLATELTPIWQASEAWLAREGIEPPFWAFAWPGSQALARLILDGALPVVGQRVLDFAAGGGLAAIAAARAGASSVEAAEVDKVARAAIALNAAANRVTLTIPADDLVGTLNRWDTVLAGDVCYAAPMAARILPWLRGLAAAGATVWLADPGRAYVPREGLVPLAKISVPTTRELEDREERVVTVARLLG